MPDLLLPPPYPPTQPLWCWRLALVLVPGARAGSWCCFLVLAGFSAGEVLCWRGSLLAGFSAGGVLCWRGSLVAGFSAGRVLCWRGSLAGGWPWSWCWCWRLALKLVLVLAAGPGAGAGACDRRRCGCWCWRLAGPMAGDACWAGRGSLLAVVARRSAATPCPSSLTPSTATAAAHANNHDRGGGVTSRERG
ncbi:unnamed protein product [Closterium sp. Naga37s-1]|nr:unnamed protein product [Closterium sp. Naga37s-1]